MLQFTKETDYGFQLIIALSKLKDGQVLSLRKFSEASKISFLFLQKVARKLREADLVKSNQGAQGGYSLNKPLGKISLKEVLEAIDGECAVSSCLRSGRECRCVKEGECDVKKIFCKINENFVNYLEKVKLGDCV